MNLLGQLFRLQLSYEIMLNLAEKGFLDDKHLEKATHETAKLFKDGIKLNDFSYEVVITDLHENKKYIA